MMPGPVVVKVHSFCPVDAEMPYVVPPCTVTKIIPFHSIGDVSATSPRFVCHSFVNVNGPEGPPVSLLTPLRAASCSASGQSSRLAVGIEVGVAVAVGVALGFAVVVDDGDGDGDGDGDAVGDGDGLGLDVGSVDDVGDDGDDVDGLELTGRGALPPPLHAVKTAAATIAIDNAQESKRNDFTTDTALRLLLARFHETVFSSTM